MIFLLKSLGEDQNNQLAGLYTLTKMLFPTMLLTVYVVQILLKYLDFLINLNTSSFIIILIFFIMQDIQKQFETQTTNLRNFDLKRFLKTVVPIPPLREQQKIAYILSNVDEQILKTNQIIEQTQRLKKGLMQRLLTKGIGHTKFRKAKMDSNLHETYPLEWGISCLSDLCKIERGKFAHRPRGDPAYYGGDYPFIQTGDIEKSDGNIETFSQTLNDKGFAVSKLFPQGIIVITIAGSNIGRTGITTFPVCFPDSVIGISTAKLNIKYLEYYLRTRRNLLQTKATVSGQPNINLETLKPLRVPVPSLKEQDKIVDIISSIDSQISFNKRMKTSLDYLKKALLQQLLTGKIRVKV